ncbi:hypothetical protein LEMLEM_LOCUS27561 [Lemmus lemmus]
MRMQMVASTTASSRSIAITGAITTRVTQRTSAAWTVKVCPGALGWESERGDQALLTGTAYACLCRHGLKSKESLG